MATLYLSVFFSPKIHFIYLCEPAEIFWNYIAIVEAFCYLTLITGWHLKISARGLSYWLDHVRELFHFFKMFIRVYYSVILLISIIATYPLISYICYQQWITFLWHLFFSYPICHPTFRPIQKPKYRYYCIGFKECLPSQCP